MDTKECLKVWLRDWSGVALGGDCLPWVFLQWTNLCPSFNLIINLWLELKTLKYVSFTAFLPFSRLCCALCRFIFFNNKSTTKLVSSIYVDVSVCALRSPSPSCSIAVSDSSTLINHTPVPNMQSCLLLLLWSYNKINTRNLVEKR